MAAPITISISISASPPKVYQALTESSGLASFWTNDSRAEAVVGSVGHFGFPSGSKLDLRIEQLEPGHRVVLKLLNDVMRGPHWEGTTVIWDLRQADNGSTDLMFQQVGWPPDLPQKAAAGVTYSWVQIIRALKGYAETGVPQPHFVVAVTP
jgi:uncharacterized protein YndB with AHSA1/START domain